MYTEKEVFELLEKLENYIDTSIDYEAIQSSCCGISVPEWDLEKFIGKEMSTKSKRNYKKYLKTKTK